MKADNGRFPLLPKIIATSLGVGYWPWGPGTAGAVLGLVLWLPVVLSGSVLVSFLITLGLIVVFTALGIWSCNIAERFWGPDPHKAVIDETVGQWIAMLPLSQYAAAVSPLSVQSFWWFTLVSLVLFRFFDIAKPLGVRRMEQFPGGTGVMADDILAGIYSAVILAIGMEIFI